MNIDLSQANWLAVVVAGLVAFFLGGLWYTALFGKLWVKLVGYSEQQIAEMKAKMSPPKFFGGMVVYFVRTDGSSLYPLLAFLAAGGSYMVSYTRARAEGLGVSCAVGWMERPERLVLLLVSTAVGPVAVRVALWALTALTFFTAAQRMLHVHRETRSP